MCSLRVKTDYLRCFLSEVGTLNESGQVVLDSTMTNTRVMKLLYCLCLESCEYSKYFGGSNLFKFFTAFKAYPKGPLEVELYNNIGALAGVSYKDGRIESCEQYVIDETNSIALMIRYICRSTRFGILLNKSVDELVELTHKLFIWREAMVCSNDKVMRTDRDDYLDLELTKYIRLLS